MPIIQRTDPLLQKIGLNRDYQLLDVRRALLDGQGFVSGVEAESAVQFFRLYENGAQANLGRLASAAGFPSIIGFAKQQIEGLDLYNATVDALMVDPVAQFEEGLRLTAGSIANAALELTELFAQQKVPSVVRFFVQAAGEVLDVAINMAANIPVYGWVIKLIYGLAKAIVALVDLVKSDAKSFERKPSGRLVVFNSDTDFKALEIANSILDGTERNWTDLFTPPSLSKNWHYTGSEFFDVNELEYPRGMWRLHAVRIADTPNAMGFVPGARTKSGDPFLHQGIQFSEKGAVVPDAGEIIYPSLTQQLGWVWNAIMGRTNLPTPSLYSIDGQFLEYAWGLYIFRLHDFIARNERMKDSWKKAILDAYRPMFGWPDRRAPKESDMERYVPVKAAKRLIERQRFFLDKSLMAAYVDRSFVAIENTQKQAWANARSLLLKHEKRCDVDLANIPDQKYRADLIEARKDCFGLAVPAQPGPKRTWRDIAERQGGRLPPEPRPPDGAEPIGIPARSSSTGGGSIVPWAGLALAGVAGLGAYRYRDKLSRLKLPKIG